MRIQIWTALIAILLLKFLLLRSGIGRSLSTLIALLRLNLFVHRDLWAWLDIPFDGPPDPPTLPTAHVTLPLIWAALIAILLLKFLQPPSRNDWRLSNLIVFYT